MQIKLQFKLALAAAGLVALALPIAVFASQPAVKLAALKPSPSLSSAQVLSMLMLDPRETGAEFTMTLPQGFATLDVDADPFGVVVE